MLVFSSFRSALFRPSVRSAVPSAIGSAVGVSNVQRNTFSTHMKPPDGGMLGHKATHPGSLMPVTGTTDLLPPLGARGVGPTSDMVAFQHPVQRLTTIDNRSATGDFPHTRTKLVPRKGASVAWTAELNDILSAKGRTNVIGEQQPPTIDSFITRLPKHDIDTIRAVHRMACQQWWSESTDVYHIVRRSIDLSGVYEEMDLEMIHNNFSFGDYRNGVGLLQWALSFTNTSAVSEQSRPHEQGTRRETGTERLDREVRGALHDASARLGYSIVKKLGWDGGPLGDKFKGPEYPPTSPHLPNLPLLLNTVPGLTVIPSTSVVLLTLAS